MIDTARAIGAFLLPWQFYPAVLLLYAGAMVLYVRGLRQSRRAGMPVGIGRPLAFFVGITLVYIVTQTHYDYLAQRMFFMHRLQHVVLHHLGAFLIVIAQPIAVLGRGLPAGFAERFIVPPWRHPVTQGVYRVLQNPFVAPVLFVGLIFFWLTPSIHFDAMLSERYYLVMNWSMFIDGLLFWTLVLDPRSRREGALLGFGARVWITLLAIPPQIALGAYITFSEHEIFDVYSVCGRAWAIDPLTDQMIGGLLTWHPATMMHAIAAVILVRRWMLADRGPDARGRPPQLSATHN